jgi:hypothetical protein
MLVVSLLGVESVLSRELVLGPIKDVILARVRMCCVPVRLMTIGKMST